MFETTDLVGEAERLRANISEKQAELARIETTLQQVSMKRLTQIREEIKILLQEAKESSAAAGLEFSAAEFVHEIEDIRQDSYWQSSSVHC